MVISVFNGYFIIVNSTISARQDEKFGSFFLWWSKSKIRGGTYPGVIWKTGRARSAEETRGERCTVSVVVHKAVRRERIKPYRRVGRFQFLVKLRAAQQVQGEHSQRRAPPSPGKGERTRKRIRTRTCMIYIWIARAGSCRGGERIIEPVKWFCCTTRILPLIPLKLISISDSIAYIDVNLFNKRSVRPSVRSEIQSV